MTWISLAGAGLLAAVHVFSQKQSKQRSKEQNNLERAEHRVFWSGAGKVPPVPSAVYRRDVRFLVNDHGLHRDHQDRYDHKGRWILATVAFAGWALKPLAGPLASARSPTPFCCSAFKLHHSKYDASSAKSAKPPIMNRLAQRESSSTWASVTISSTATVRRMPAVNANRPSFTQSGAPRTPQ